MVHSNNRFYENHNVGYILHIKLLYGGYTNGQGKEKESAQN